MANEEDVVLDVSTGEEAVGCTLTESDETVNYVVSEDIEEIDIGSISEDEENINYSLVEENENVNLSLEDGVPVVGTGDKHFVYTQPVPSDRWVINHGLDKYPSVTVVDSAESIVIGSCEYIDANNVILTFNGSFSGKAYFN